jgi:hypothetical protein
MKKIVEKKTKEVYPSKMAKAKKEMIKEYGMKAAMKKMSKK